MSTLVIVGAGPGLGRAVARRFGAEGFDVALIGRTEATVGTVADDLSGQGIRAVPFVADVTDRPALARALDAVRARFGQVDVLEYSPAPTSPGAVGAVGAVELTVDALRPQLDVHLFGAVTAIGQVLPAMIDRGSGTILVTTGASSGPVVHPPFANIAAAAGALRNWVLNLHAALEPSGVYAAHVAIATWIGREGPASQPEAIAEAYWRLHVDRRDPELLYAAPGAS